MLVESETSEYSNNDICQLNVENESVYLDYLLRIHVGYVQDKVQDYQSYLEIFVYFSVY
jgi:hypothetical protein